jgi:hypothetical protein
MYKEEMKASQVYLSLAIFFTVGWLLSSANSEATLNYSWLLLMKSAVSL